MRTIAENTYDFGEIRNTDAVYVDKTAYFHSLIANAGRKLYFISRPRRFGKSLMISTLKAIFEGRRELFKGLAIDEVPYDWQTYPIIHFIFSGVSTRDIETFRSDFASHVARALKDVGYDYDFAKTPGSNFSDAILSVKARTGKGAVLLVDEYDAPIGHALDDPELAEAIRRELATFYIQIKDNVGILRFMMMTGVSRLAKLSVFSALSNLTDLTFDPKFAGMLGYTAQDLDEYFAEHMRAHAAVMKLPQRDYLERLMQWYDSYRFSPKSDVTVYNPIAIGVTLANQDDEFHATWSKTGRPSMLMNYFKGNPIAEYDFENIPGVQDDIFDVADLSDINPISLLFQAGYLTIRDYDTPYYTLGVPNEEVRRDLNSAILVKQTGKTHSTVISPIGYALKHADAERLRSALAALYAALYYSPAEIATDCIYEASYVRDLISALHAIGYHVTPEASQSNGRSDLVAVGEQNVYVFEFKLNESAEAVMAQIHEKKYWLPYVDGGKSIYAIGLGFDSRTRHLVDFKFETVLRAGGCGDI